MNRCRIGLKDFINDIKGCSVAVLGVGISNRPLIRQLFEWGAKITAFDSLDANDKVLSQTIRDFENDGIEMSWSVGSDYLKGLENETFKYIFKTPKMRPDLDIITQARMRGSIITSEIELFMQLCPAQIFGVTGSDGKTTTTTLIAEMLKEEGYNVHLGGNIGTPLLDQIDIIKPDDLVVLELSSFQLMTMSQSPNISVVTNISPNHLDFHKNYQEYIDAKRNIFTHQGISDFLIINVENVVTSLFQDEHKGHLSVFSSSDRPAFSHLDARVSSQFFFRDEAIYYRHQERLEKVVDIEKIALMGNHNLENILAAAAAVFPFVGIKAIRHVAETFKGVEHRIEPVRTLNGVTFYNSSIDTSPNRTIHTMNALFDSNRKGVLIAGGQDKACDYTGLGFAIGRVCSRVVLFGENAKHIERIIQKECKDTDVYVYHAHDYMDAVAQAFRMASTGECVILSPAGTSYDYFRHFEERGLYYKEIVMNLEE